MKFVKFIAAVIIAGIPHEPHGETDDPMPFENDAADALIAADLAEEVDGLDAKTLEQLAVIVADEGVPLDGATKKADVIAAIRAHRLAA